MDPKCQKYETDFLGPVYTKRQRQRCDNSAMTLAILFSLKSVESLENRLQPHSGVTPFFSMRTESQASSLSCHRVDADAWCKWALTAHPSRYFVPDLQNFLSYPLFCWVSDLSESDNGDLS